MVEQAEEEERAAIAEPGGELPAAEIAEALEQVKQKRVDADRPQGDIAELPAGRGLGGERFRFRFEEERHERLPELLAQAEQEHRQQHDADGAIDREKVGQAVSWGFIHAGVRRVCAFLPFAY